MSKKIEDLSLGLDEDLKEKLQWLVGNYSDHRILKQSVDARRGHPPRFIYSVEVAQDGEALAQPSFEIEKLPELSKLHSGQRQKPIIVGTGPAGLFCALRLAERGLPSIIFERGSVAEKRIMGINRYWRYGELDLNNNVCIGEGGAGLYSDGKLITRIKSPHIPYVLSKMVQFGAPGEIEYLANPHVGSDKIRRIIPFMRRYLLKLGCEIHFDSPLTDIVVASGRIGGVKIGDAANSARGETFFQSDQVVIATGHSATDILECFHRHNVFMEGKSFALGLRVEHPQKWINQIQYREWGEHPKLKAANYRLAHHNRATDTGVYSFCMCPGGFVLASGTEADGVVVNGMSNYNRNSPFANSAIVVSVSHEKSFGKDLFGGLKFRRELERRAFESVKALGGHQQLPAQRLIDFLENKPSRQLPKTSSPSGAIPVRLDQLLPKDLQNSLHIGLEKFHERMRGFIHESAQLYGIESRTSSPVRVTRDADSLMSVSHPGLYPAGEGAGYAGGITSAACDGVRIAEKIYETYL